MMDVYGPAPPVGLMQDAHLPGPKVAWVTAQRVLPDHVRTEYEVDVRARRPLREVSTVGADERQRCDGVSNRRLGLDFHQDGVECLRPSFQLRSMGSNLP